MIILTKELLILLNKNIEEQKTNITPNMVMLVMPRPNEVFMITLDLIYFRAEPDLEFEGLLKRQHTRVKYFQGSLMNAMDLERSKVTTGLPKIQEDRV